MKERKKRHAGKAGKRASCGIRMGPGAIRVTTPEEFRQADAGGTLCRRRRNSAANEASPY